jgi:uncharacterized protein YbaR (Trm112 family)
LSRAEADLIDVTNRAIGGGLVRDGWGNNRSEPLEAGLINREQSHLYPVVGGIPRMLREEVIVLQATQWSRLDRDPKPKRSNPDE